MSGESATLVKLRLDRWLWAARFFKTRSLAAEAIAQQRVRVDGQRAKPSRPLVPGSRLLIEKGPYVFEVTVLALAAERRPAAEASRLYEESSESVARREALAGRLRADREARLGLAGEGRPTKRQRRQIIRFQQRGDGGD